MCVCVYVCRVFMLSLCCAFPRARQEAREREEREGKGREEGGEEGGEEGEPTRITHT